MGYKFSNEFRREAVELYESGLSAAAVFDRLEAAHGVRPSRATLTLWVAAHRHGVDQDLVDDAERVRECAAEVIGRVVASRGDEAVQRRGPLGAVAHVEQPRLAADREGAAVDTAATT
mgnify:CR=1 FL=1